MTLTPTQNLLARAAARRIIRSQIAVLQDGSRPSRVALTYEEAQCLLAAAAPTLELEADALDLGPYSGPGDDRLLHAYRATAEGELIPLDPAANAAA
jgi:hypothetical protein